MGGREIQKRIWGQEEGRMREGWGGQGGAAENERNEIDVETEMGKKKNGGAGRERGWSRPEGEKPRSEPHKWPHQDCLNPQAQTVFEGLFWVYVCFETESHVPQAGLKLTIADNSELLILLSPPQCWTNRCAHRPPLLPRLSRNAGLGSRAPIRNTRSPISLPDSGNSPEGQEDPLVQCLHEDQ